MKNPDNPFSQSITSHSPDPTIIKKSDYYTYHSRPCLSYFKKGVFSMQEGHVLKYRKASSQMQKGIFSNAEGHILKCRRACSQIQKGMFSNTEGHVLKYRKACSQIQKGPFFFFNTHALHSCGAKQIYIKIKYSSPHMPSILPTHFPSTPSPLSPLRYSPNLFICYPVSSRIQLVHSSPRQHVNLPVTHRTCSSVTLSPLATNLFPRLPINSSTCPLLLELVHLLPCLLSPPTCPLVHSSTRQLTMLLPELVHLLPCLLIHLTCPLVPSLIRLLVNYFYHLTFLSVLV